MKGSNDTALLDNRFMRVGLDLLEVLDPSKTYEVQLALTMLYMAKPLYTFCGDHYLKTTPSLLIRQFGNNENITRRQQVNVVEAMGSLCDKGLVMINKELGFKEEMQIDVKPLLELAESGEFVKISFTDFHTIMECEQPLNVKGKEKLIYGIESLLLSALFYISGSYNCKNLAYLMEFDEGEVARDISHDEKLQSLKYVFCNATLDQIRTHKHPRLTETKTWVDEDYLSAVINKLEELNVVKIYRSRIVGENGKWRNMNFYYPPEIPDCNMEVMIKQYSKRNNYAIKNR